MTWTWRSYQEEDIKTLVEAKAGLLSLPMGAGKTPIAIEVVRRLGAKRIMVTAPINTQEKGWARHFQMFTPELPIYYVNAKTQDEVLAKLKDGEPGVWIVGYEYGRGYRRKVKDDNGEFKTIRYANGKEEHVYETLREPLDWSKYPLDAAIIDESARIGNRRSQQTKVVHTAKKVPIKLALSATPAGNRVEGIWSTLHWLWPEKFRYFGPWVKAYMVEERNTFADKKLPNGKVIPGKTIVGEKRPGIVKRSIPTFVKRTEEEVHADLPEVVPHDVPVKLTAAQRKVYRQFEEDALAWLDNHPVATALPITKDIRLKETLLAVPSVNEDDEVVFKPGAASSKLDMMMDILTDLPPNEKVLVWTHSRKIIPVVLDRLDKAGIEAVAAYGDQTKGAREAALDSFKSAEGAQVLVATIPTLGEGVDGLQHVCATEIWLSQYTVVLNKQASGRLRRPGQKRTINRFVIRAVDTVETRQLGRLKDSQEALVAADFM